jgi:hypothetical protein
MLSSSEKNMHALFDQLGLESSPEAIDQFVKSKSLPKGISLQDAEFWNESQSAFLKEVIELDADWAIVVDQLDELVR